TPHIWTSYGNSIESIPPHVSRLQAMLDAEVIELRLIAGGEINLRPEYSSATPSDQVVTYALARKFALIDMWHERIPEYVGPSIRWLQSLGLKVILAHPERMRAVQDDPAVIEFFTSLGVLLQGNLQCFSETVTAQTRRTAERLLAEGKYFLLGSDLHGLETLPPRLAGLERARQLAGDKIIDQLTRENPRQLLPS